MLITIIGANFNPKIRDQLWILVRVYRKYPNKIFFDCDFGCVVALSYLIGKFGQSGKKQKKTSVSILGKYTLT